MALLYVLQVVEGGVGVGVSEGSIVGTLVGVGVRVGGGAAIGS